MLSILRRAAIVVPPDEAMRRAAAAVGQVGGGDPGARPARHLRLGEDGDEAAVGGDAFGPLRMDSLIFVLQRRRF